MQMNTVSRVQTSKPKGQANDLTKAKDSERSANRRRQKNKRRDDGEDRNVEMNGPARFGTENSEAVSDDARILHKQYSFV